MPNLLKGIEKFIEEIIEDVTGIDLDAKRKKHHKHHPKKHHVIADITFDMPTTKTGV